MKKTLILLCVLLCFSLVACGGKDIPPETTPIDNSFQEPVKEYYFKDNVVKIRDLELKITDYKVIPVGEKGNEYGSKPVIAFWYDTTNLSENENLTPTMAWIAVFTAIQDNDPNAINTLNVAALPDTTFLHSQLQMIKKGGTVKNAMAYELDDITTPVLLKATRGAGGEALGEQVFEISTRTASADAGGPYDSNTLGITLESLVKKLKQIPDTSLEELISKPYNDGDDGDINVLYKAAYGSDSAEIFVIVNKENKIKSVLLSGPIEKIADLSMPNFTLMTFAGHVAQNLGVTEKISDFTTDFGLAIHTNDRILKEVNGISIYSEIIDNVQYVSFYIAAK